MALMDLKSDLSWYGKKPPVANNINNIDHKGFTANIMPIGSNRPDSKFIGITGTRVGMKYTSTSTLGTLSLLSQPSTNTKFNNDGTSPSVTVSGFDAEGNILPPVSKIAADSFLIDDVTYSGRGLASRAAQLGDGSKFPIGPTGERHPFDKDPRTGFSADARYSDQYGVKFGDSGLADTYTANSPIDDMYDKLNLRDDAHNNSYIRQPYILRGIQRKVGKNRNEPQFWGVEGKSVAGQIDSALDLPRGGILANVERTAIDAARIGKFLISPKGIGFLAKQVGYQLMNPISNTRIYNPLSLGSIAPIVHINRHVGTGFLEKKLPNLLGNIGGALDLQQSRLETLLKEDRDTKAIFNEKRVKGDKWKTLSQKIGGPGSILGIGGTDYFKQHDTTFEAQLAAGLKLDTWHSNPYGGYHNWYYGLGNYVQTRGDGGARTFEEIENLNGLKTKHEKSLKPNDDAMFQHQAWPAINPDRGGDGKSNIGGGRSSNSEDDIGTDYTLLAYKDIPKRKPGAKKEILRTNANLYKQADKDGKNTELTEGQSNFEKSLKLIHKIDEELDESLIPFKFGDIAFKAYLGTISDNFAPSWDSQPDHGRADPRYQYTGFERTLSFDFMVASEKSAFALDIWKKLQSLGQFTHPVYGEQGFYGQTTNVTIGKLFVNKPMIITDLGFDWDNETPWEIDEDYQAPMYTSVQMTCTVLGNRPQSTSKLYGIQGL